MTQACGFIRPLQFNLVIGIFWKRFATRVSVDFPNPFAKIPWNTVVLTESFCVVFLGEIIPQTSELVE